MPNKDKKQIQCPATFTRDEAGYLLPIYPKNPTQDVRDHIIESAERARGMRPNEMSIQQIWCVNAASRLRVDAPKQKQPAATTPDTDEKFKAVMAKVIAPAI